jgi:flagellar basal body L-ring protein FlgH
MVCFPWVSSKNMAISPLDETLKVENTSYVLPNGYLEFSVEGNFFFRNNKSLSIQLRRAQTVEDPITIRLRINDQDYFQEEYENKLIALNFPLNNMKNLLFTGSNLFEIITEKQEELFIRIRID